MREGLGLEVWDHPEERRRVVGEALARWDEALLKEALWAYLVRHRKKPDRAAPHYVGYFVRWLALKGRRWPHLEPEDPKAFLLEAKEKGFPGGERGPMAWSTVERARASLRHLFPFLDWAGHPMPSHVRLPSRQELPVVAPSRAMPEEAYRDLLEKAGAYPLAYWRPLLRVLLVLLGEVGLTVKEAVELWQEDVREKVLLVRGAKLREVPLSPSPGRSSPTGSPRGPSSPPTSPSPTPTSSSSPPRGRTGEAPWPGGGQVDPHRVRGLRRGEGGGQAAGRPRPPLALAGHPPLPQRRPPQGEGGLLDRDEEPRGPGVGGGVKCASRSQKPVAPGDYPPPPGLGSLGPKPGVVRARGLPQPPVYLYPAVLHALQEVPPPPRAPPRRRA